MKRQWWRALVLAGIAAFAACSDELPGEKTAASSQALTSTARILSFESVASDWSTTAGTISASTDRVEGDYALAAANTGNATFTSAPLSNLSGVGDSLTIDVACPSPAPNPYWLGTLRIVLESPTLQLYWADLGEQALHTPLGEFVRYTFPIPADVKAKLNGSSGGYSDLVVKVVANVPSAPGPWKFDRISFGQASEFDAGAPDSGSGAGGSGGSSGGGFSGQATGGASGGGVGGSPTVTCPAPTRPVEFRIELPEGVRRDDVAMATRDWDLDIHDGVRITKSSGGFASVSAVSRRAMLGVEAEVGDVWGHDVLLRSEAHVHGDIVSPEPVERQQGAVVDGAIIDRALTPHRVESWTVCFPATEDASDIRLEPGQQYPSATSTLEPGGYGWLSVKSRAVLRLRAGGATYFFENISVEPEGTILVDGTGPLSIYVRGGATFRGVFMRLQDQPGGVLLASERAGISLDTPIRATVVAPENEIILATPATGFAHTYQGAYYAKGIIAHQWTEIIHEPLDPALLCPAGSPCSALCPCDPGGVCSQTSDCVPELVCGGGQCRDCATDPTAPGCELDHCTNGTQDEDETGVDCGGGCPGCPTGGPCDGDGDCADGLTCGSNNGACFGLARAERRCWAPSCQDDVVEEGECGTPDSPCGENCACVTPCDPTDPNSTCPEGEECQAGLGEPLGLDAKGACLDVICPTDDPAYCGSPAALCGPQCICTPDCSAATCADPGDGCGNECPGVCDPGECGCQDDLHCQPGFVCMDSGDGCSSCRPEACSLRVLEPPLCGSPGAPCGDECPACTPRCEGRSCGPDPNCGADCGSCGDGTTCNIDGQCVAPTTDPPVTVPTGDGGTRDLVDIPPTPANAIGALPGRFGVSEQGTAEYTVPIEVPPGRAGMEPALSLQYTASRANGDAGVGWRLEGLSKITRCPRTYALDGYSAPIKNDPSDRFCIDGKRLESVSGTYGAHATQYRTLIDSFAKVVSYNDDGESVQLDWWPGVTLATRDEQGPDYFKVWTKDGRILTFGRTRDAIVLGRNGVRSGWMLSRVEDRAGNTMLVAYTNIAANAPKALNLALPNLVRPSMIAYTGHGDTAGNREVRFSYDTRTDPQLTFQQGGVPHYAVERLSRITTYVEGAAVKNYALVYAADDVSQIEKIFECAGADSSVCKPPTTFEYEQQSGFETVAYGPDVGAAAQLDVNGDGVPDFLKTAASVDGVAADPVLIGAQLSTDLAIAVGSAFMSMGAGLAVTVAWNVVKRPFWGFFADDPEIDIEQTMLLGNDNRLEGPEWVHDVAGIRCPRSPSFILDYDHDGQDDLLSSCAGNLFVARSLGNGHFEQLSDTPIVELQIDRIPGASSSSFFPNTSKPGPAPIMYDVNGDSLQDVVSCKDTHTLELRLRVRPAGSTPLPFLAPIAYSRVPFVEEAHPLCRETRPTYQIFDIDGDGTPELVVRGPERWQVLRYQPTDDDPLSWQDLDFPDVGFSAYGEGLRLGDFNGDGLLDVWRAKDDQAQIWVNNGAGRFTAKNLVHPQAALGFGDETLPGPVPVTRPIFAYARNAILDYDADGRSDVIEHWAGSENRRYNAALIPNSLHTDLLEVGQPDDLHWFVNGDRYPGGFTKVGDLDGDGNADLFGHVNAIFYGKGLKNRLLKRVVDGLGNVVEVLHQDGSYTHSCEGQSWPEVCLRRMSGLVSGHSEGFLDDAGQLHVERRYSYRYENARMNVAGHGWLGFDRRTVTESVNNAERRTITTAYEPPTRYSLDGTPTASTGWPYVYPLAGLPKTIITDAHLTSDVAASPLEDAKYAHRSRVENTWEVGVSASNRPYPRLQSRSSVTFQRQVPDPPAAPDFEDDGLPVTDCFESFGVDSYGNVVAWDERCQNDNQLYVERTLVTTTFEPDASEWLISNPEFVQIMSNRVNPGETQAYDLRYDALGLLESVERAPPGFGDLAQRKITGYKRDGLGNVERITESAVGSDPRVTLIEYDADKVFPKSITNALGHATEVRFDARWGAPKTIADPNGIAVQHGYDDLGLLVETRDPEGTSVYRYDLAPEQRASTAVGDIHPRIRVTVERQGTDGTRTGAVAQDFDNYGRPVRSRGEGFAGQEVVSERVYDAIGRVQGMTTPHTAGASIVPTATNTYDHLDRLVRVDRSDGTSVEQHYASTVTLHQDFAQWLDGVDCSGPATPCSHIGVIRTIDEEGRQNVAITDHRGNVLRSIDGDNVDDTQHTSNYRYGNFNRLIETRDNLGHVTSFVYDPYGRTLTHTDPDSGPTSFTYNGHDELLTSTDPVNVTRNYHYDLLGRLRGIVDPQGQTQWIFDQGDNALGRLSETISPATPENPGGQRVRYTYEPATATNNRGLLERADYTIDGTEYPLALEYDGLGRTQRLLYPRLGTTQRVIAEYHYCYRAYLMT